MQPCILPAPLKPGDLIAVIAPSGALRERDALEKGMQIWQSRGYQLKLCPGYDDRWGYLAGTDQARRTQLRAALQDPACRGLLCLRGGYGGARLLEDWRWPDSSNMPNPPAPLGLESGSEPKWLIGFSDITSLLWGLACQGISGVHGPLLTTLYAEPDWSIERLFNWLEGNSLVGDRSSCLEPLIGAGWGGGQTSGLLLPANLTVATHLLGTAAQPDLANTILAFEDVSEAPYRIDRMLTQWRMIEAFKGVKGIAIGRFSQCEPVPNIPSFTVAEVLQDRLADLGIPVVADLPFGHEGVNAALPVGVPVTLDGDRGVLSFG
jgi:muramoyltetrapeptide carboxypeptidase